MAGRQSTSPRVDGKAPQGLVMMAVGALGVVYGDLGTSPLYSIREAFVSPEHRLPVDRVHVLGAVSVIIYTLVVIIAVKYVIFVMQADNGGEGGVLALTALIANRSPRHGSKTPALVLLGLFGTALLYGDGMITPAISVLSAVEGITLSAPSLKWLVVPLSIAILLVLFSIQRFGTGTVGKAFGPVMLLWFGTTALLGTVSLVRTPEIFNAFNPVNAVRYFSSNIGRAFLSMGSLFLVVTGGEALYADMGHFGRRPIRMGWFGLVMPALLLTYLGIGGLLLRQPAAIESPFFLLAPSALQLPVVILAMVATVIASQALISGVFSITLQAIQLGYAPRSRVVVTSATSRGQIYIPVVNWALAIACISLVLLFRSSGALASAFGLSVTGTMFITTILFCVFARQHWHAPRIVVWPFGGAVLAIEGTYLLANMFKIPKGGWVPLVVGGVVFAQLTTWKTGKELVRERVRRDRASLHQFAKELTGGSRRSVVRVRGRSVFLFSEPGLVPPSLVNFVRASGSLHTHVYVVAVNTTNSPRTEPAARMERTDIGAGIHQVILNYGFMEATPVADDLEVHLGLSPSSTEFFLGRETVHSTPGSGMARWREVLFGVMNRNATDVGSFFQLPPERVTEVGTRINI